MDTAMRDLERIRESDPEEGRARQYGVWALAALTTTALVAALGMMLGRPGHDDAAKAAADPLSSLDGLAAAGATDTAEADEPEVDRESLTFPTALTEERPEVAAAVAAAGAELAHPDPVGAFDDLPPRREEPAADPVPPSVPAAAAAAPTADVLARTVQSDPLMRAAEHAPRTERPDAPTGPVSAGHDGRYTLQVISYKSPEEARLFAETLRDRGHHAFVVSADLGERGTFWRVRIGPFKSLHEAEDYRADFEEAEGMNTYVVKGE